MFERWNLTVCSAIQSMRATSAFEWPSATSRRISASRRVTPTGIASPTCGRPRLRAGRAGGDVDGVRERLAHRVGEILGLHGLEDVRDGAGRERSLDPRAVARGGEDDRACVGPELACPLRKVSASIGLSCPSRPTTIRVGRVLAEQRPARPPATSSSARTPTSMRSSTPRDCFQPQRMLVDQERSSLRRCVSRLQRGRPSKVWGAIVSLEEVIPDFGGFWKGTGASNRRPAQATGGLRPRRTASALDFRPGRCAARRWIGCADGAGWPRPGAAGGAASGLDLEADAGAPRERAAWRPSRRPVSFGGNPVPPRPPSFFARRG